MEIRERRWGEMGGREGDRWEEMGGRGGRDVGIIGWK